MAPSLPADARVRPSGENSSDSMRAACPRSDVYAGTLPVRSHRVMVPSSLATARVRPPPRRGLNAIADTLPLPATSSRVSCLVLESRSQRLTEPSSCPRARSFLLGDVAQEETGCSYPGKRVDSWPVAT